MAKVRRFGDKNSRGTQYVLWYQGYKQCFRTLAAAHRAQKALSWVEYQDSQITDADGNDIE
jgi:hypothetical protein